MATTIKQLITNNKQAFDHSYFIESISLSYILINKALKQILKDELKQEAIDPKIKTSILISLIKKELETNPGLKTKVSKKVLKDISLFISLYKTIQSFQYPPNSYHAGGSLHCPLLPSLEHLLPYYSPKLKFLSTIKRLP